MGANFLRHGSHNVICDRSGFKIKKEDSVKEWTGLRVHKKFVEQRHPQDKLRMYEDNQRVPDPRTEGVDVFLGVGDISINDL